MRIDCDSQLVDKKQALANGGGRKQLQRRHVVAALASVYGLTATLAFTFGLAGKHTAISFVLVSAALGAILVLLSVIDIEQFRLPDVVTLPLIPAGLLHAWAIGPEAAAFFHLLAAAAAYGALFLVKWAYRQWRGIDGLGLGDAKLLAGSGAWLGPTALPSVMLIAATAGLALALVVSLRLGKVSGRTMIPFGPCLAFAFWIVWLWGPLEI